MEESERRHFHSDAEELSQNTWRVIVIGWGIILLPFPGTGIIGSIVAGTAGMILSIMVMVKGHATAGVFQLLCALLGTPIIYALSWLIWASLLSSAL